MNRYFIAGFIAGEGCFSFYEKTTTNCYFTIEVHVRDRSMLEEIKNIFNFGNITTYAGRPNICRFQINGMKNNRLLVVPFMDKYLVGSYKREQYDIWKKKILSYKLKKGKGRKPRITVGLIHK